MRIIQITDMLGIESENLAEDDRINSINGISIKEMDNIKDELTKEKVVITKTTGDEEYELNEEEVKVIKKNLFRLLKRFCLL